MDKILNKLFKINISYVLNQQIIIINENVKELLYLEGNVSNSTKNGNFNKLVSKQYDFYYTIVFLIPFPIISTTGNQPINNIAYANIILFTSFIGGYVAANFPKNF